VLQPGGARLSEFDELLVTARHAVPSTGPPFL
jgi:hypothetical protein